MTIRVALHHYTEYRFDRPVALSPHVLRLRPAAHCRTPIVSYSLDIQPREHFINWMQDPFGNYLARLVFPEKCRELIVQVDLVAEMTVINPFDFFLEESANDYPFTYDAGLARNAGCGQDRRDHVATDLRFSKRGAAGADFSQEARPRGTPGRDPSLKRSSGI